MQIDELTPLRRAELEQSARRLEELNAGILPPECQFEASVWMRFRLNGAYSVDGHVRYKIAKQNKDLETPDV